MKIDIVGGPANGEQAERPTTSTVIVPVIGAGGFGTFSYTLRKCRDANGDLVEVLAPAGQNIDPRYLASHKLKN